MTSEQAAGELVRSLRRRIADFQLAAYRSAEADPMAAVEALEGAQATRALLIELLVGTIAWNGVSAPTVRPIGAGRR